MNIRITGCTSDLLYIVHKCAGRRHMIHPVDITDIHTHAECLCSHNHALPAFFELLYNSSFLFFVLLTIVGGDQMPIRRFHPRFQTHVDTTCKRIIKNSLMPVEEILHTASHNTLFGFIIGFSFLYLHLPDIKADVPAFHCTCIKHTWLHLQ